jgi:hypothetical protein
MKKNLLPYFFLFIVLMSASCKKTESTAPVTPTPVVDSLKIGLLAYYPLNNSGADSSGKGNDVYAYYAITSVANRFNKPNSAFSFNGTSSYMIIKDKADLRLSNTNFTTNVWVYMEAYNTSFGSEILCKRGTGSTNGWNYSVFGNGSLNTAPIGSTSFQVSGGTDPLAPGGKAIGLNQWHMLTTVYDVTKKQITFYIDGVLDKTTSNIPSPVSTATADLYIGADSQGPDYKYKGSIDDIKIYNRALPQNQITKLFTTNN